MQTGGQTTTTEPPPPPPGGDPAASLDAEPNPDPDKARWLDRASTVVDERVTRLGEGYLRRLISGFERRWREAEEAREKAPPPPAAPPPP
jgi:hypothetical protein